VAEGNAPPEAFASTNLTAPSLRALSPLSPVRSDATAGGLTWHVQLVLPPAGSSSGDPRTFAADGSIKPCRPLPTMFAADFFGALRQNPDSGPQPSCVFSLFISRGWPQLILRDCAWFYYSSPCALCSTKKKHKHARPRPVGATGTSGRHQRLARARVSIGAREHNASQGRQDGHAPPAVGRCGQPRKQPERRGQRGGAVLDTRARCRPNLSHRVSGRNDVPGYPRRAGVDDRGLLRRQPRPRVLGHDSPLEQQQWKQR
jgi:hypothetical protein